MNGLTAAATSAIPNGAVEGAIVAVVILGFLAIAGRGDRFVHLPRICVLA